jgi:hypothetical protein
MDARGADVCGGGPGAPCLDGRTRYRVHRRAVAINLTSAAPDQAGMLAWQPARVTTTPCHRGAVEDEPKDMVRSTSIRRQAGCNLPTTVKLTGSSH